MSFHQPGAATACAILCLSAIPANATTRTVSPSGNDTAAVQKAINASAVGDVVQFNAGNYYLSGVTLKSGVSLQGLTGAVLYDTADAVPIFQLNPSDGHDISLTGLNFVGTGVDTSHGAVELIGDTFTSTNGSNHISVMNCTFKKNGLRWVILKNSVISGNTVSDIATQWGSALFGYYADSVTISHNTITNVFQPISMVNSGADQGANIVVSYNKASGISRMGIEIQGQGATNETTNLLVQGNHFTNWVNPVADGNTIAYSIVTTGTGTRVLDNYAQGKVSTGIGIELSGAAAAAKYNYIDGFAMGIIGYMTRDNISYNNVINNAWGASAQINTFGRTDEIVVGNTSDPNLPIPFGSPALGAPLSTASN
jgi:hypothetical protein